MKFEFLVDAKAIAQPRQRVRAIKVGDRHMGSQYTPNRHSVHDYKAAVRRSYHAVVSTEHTFERWSDSPLFTEPIRLRLLFALRRPQSRLKKSQPNPAEWCPRGADVDNMCKSTMDALNTFAWKDDRQVVDLCVQKTYGPERRFGVLITIERAADRFLLPVFSPGE